MPLRRQLFGQQHRLPPGQLQRFRDVRKRPAGGDQAEHLPLRFFAFQQRARAGFPLPVKPQPEIVRIHLRGHPIQRKGRCPPVAFRDGQKLPAVQVPLVLAEAGNLRQFVHRFRHVAGDHPQHPVGRVQVGRLLLPHGPFAAPFAQLFVQFGVGMVFPVILQHPDEAALSRHPFIVGMAVDQRQIAVRGLLRQMKPERRQHVLPFAALVPHFPLRLVPFACAGPHHLPVAVPFGDGHLGVQEEPVLLPLLEAVDKHQIHLPTSGKKWGRTKKAPLDEDRGVLPHSSRFY